jgi:spore cortex biosynthesis protein YabQ
MSLSTQFYTILAMIGMGSWVGAALDTYGRFLKRPTRAHWVNFINDILFWILQALIIFYILLLINEGELRFYIFIALLCGFSAYQSLIKTYYVRLLETVIKCVKAAYRFVIKTIHLIVIRPIQLFLQLLLAIAVGIFTFLKSIGKWLFKLIWALLRILLMPLKWIGQVFLNILPLGMKKQIRIFLNSLAGFKGKIKNIKDIIRKWLQKFQKS